MTFGKVTLRPSPTEDAVMIIGAGAICAGIWTGGKPGVALGALGTLALAGVGLAMWEEARTFVDPPSMNSYFVTGGRLSATHGDGEAALLAGGEG